MEQRTPVEFEITRRGRESERIKADAVAQEGDKFVFRLQQVTVKEFFVHALDCDPKPIYAPTPEEQAQVNGDWSKLAREADMPTEYLSDDQLR